MKHQVSAKTEQSNELSQKEVMRRQRLSFLNMNFKSMSNIEEMENQPAYMRMGINITSSKDDELSNYSSSKENGLRETNSFLHENVD